MLQLLQKVVHKVKEGRVGIAAFGKNHIPAVSAQFVQELVNSRRKMDSLQAETEKLSYSACSELGGR